MRYPIKPAAAIVFATVLATTAAGAAEPAHEHGVGRLDIAIEGQDVEIELTVPGADAVGFEHAPSTDEDRQAIAAAVDKLKKAGNLFQFPTAAGCRVEEAEVHAAELDGDHDDGEHKHDKAHDDEHDHGKKGDEEEDHAEFRAHYHVHCEDPAKLTHMDVGFFKAFPTAHELEARWITPKGQGADELTGAAARLTF